MLKSLLFPLVFILCFFSTTLLHGDIHKRYISSKGPIHVFIPSGYSYSTAGVVIYVHGHGDTVDTSWINQNLQQQFKTSNRNAIFISVEAPSKRSQGVVWSSLSSLLVELTRLNIPLPAGPIVAVAHSRGWETVAGWVYYPGLTDIVLLDGMYGGWKNFSFFISLPEKKMIVVSKNTAKMGRRFAAEHKQVIHIYTTYSHSAIVSGGKMIPYILKNFTSLRSIP